MIRVKIIRTPSPGEEQQSTVWDPFSGSWASQNNTRVRCTFLFPRPQPNLDASALPCQSCTSLFLRHMPPAFRTTGCPLNGAWPSEISKLELYVTFHRAHSIFRQVIILKRPFELEHAAQLRSKNDLFHQRRMGTQLDVLKDWS